MRKIINLIKYEIKILVKSIALMSIIFTVFLSVLFGVLSVRVDVSKNLYNNLDNVSDTFTVSISDIDFETVNKECTDKLIWAKNKGVTYDAVINNSDGIAFNTNQSFIIDDELIVNSYGGCIFNLNETTLLALNNEMQSLMKGQWLNNEFQICLEKVIAEALNIEIGDTVTINDTNFIVEAVYDKDKINNVSDFDFYYFMALNDSCSYDKVEIICHGSSDAHSLYKKFISIGYEAELPYFFIDYFNNISTMESFLTAVAILIFMVIVVILYSLISIFFKQRKKYICQLKFLGANDFEIMGVYCGISLLILFITTILTSVLALLFNLYFMQLCSTLFEFTFAASYNFLLPFVVFISLSVLIFIMYFIVNHQTKSSTIAQEIKHE